MNWKDAYKEVIPLHYLREHAHKSNRELASSLSELTVADFEKFVTLGAIETV